MDEEVEKSKPNRGSVYLQLSKDMFRSFNSDVVPDIGEIVEVDQNLTTNGSPVWVRVTKRNWKLKKVSEPADSNDAELVVWLETEPVY